MANYPSKTKISTALSSRSQQNIGGIHVSTGNFMQCNVSKCIELVPEQTIDVKHQLFSRLSPLAVPTFGRGTIRNYAFWVPFRTIMREWNEFIVDTPTVGAEDIPNIIDTCPFILNDVLLGSLISTSEVVTTSGAAYDFEVVHFSPEGSTHSSVKKYKLDASGRQFFKILRSLGYGIVFDTSSQYKHSAMPLLAYLKIFLDWFQPSQYALDPVVVKIQALFDKKYSDYKETGIIETSAELVLFMEHILYLSYDDSMFTSAWDSPNGPNNLTLNNLASDFIIKSPDNTPGNSFNSSVYYDPDGTGPDSGAPAVVGMIYNNGSPTGVSAFSQSALDNLKALTDYLKRHQIAGSRVLDRYLARFGVTLDSAKLDRSILIESYSQEIQFGDVVSTASTEGAGLGDYAGKGLSYGDGSFKLNTGDEYGMFIVITSIIPHTGYYQGALRHTRHLAKTDFWTPEFDNVTAQAISRSEVFIPMRGLSVSSFLENYFHQIFGFMPRYGEYRIGVDQLTGDFVLGSMNVGMDSWHLFRDLQPYFDSGSMVHSPEFISSYNDHEQFDRIFQNVDDNADKFFLIHNFDIRSSFPGKSLYDNYEFENEDESKKVSVEVGGTTLT